MSFYFATIILTELLMLAMTIHVVGYSGFERTQKDWFVLTFLCIMMCSAEEYAVHCGLYDISLSKMLTVLTVIQFSTAPVLAMLFTGALGLRHQAKIAGIYFAVNLAVEAIAAPFGLIFYFNESGYFRGQYFLIYEFFYVISLIYLIVGMSIAGKKFRHRDKGTILMILVILVAGIIPMTFFKLNITYVAIAIGASLCYIYYNDLNQEDTLSDLVSNQEKMSRMQEHIISGMANLIESRDTETGEHIARTSAYVKMLAEYARDDGVYADEISDHFIELMYTLAPMHDVGKIVVPDHILKKPGRLTDEEFDQMKQHAAAGGKVVRNVLNGITEEEFLSFASDIATYHHEKWDGSGYPTGKKGEEIPLSARIMAIADVFDALISERCYKKALPVEKALSIIEEGAGAHFDPQLAAVFLNHRSDFV